MTMTTPSERDEPDRRVATGSEDVNWPEQHERLLADMRPQDLPTLYHYTSVAGALAILKSGCLWLSSSTGMNDHAEGALIPEVLRDCVVGRPDLEASHVANALWQTAVVPHGQAYLTCFSEHGDLLSQWRGYTQDGEGMAIGFNANDGRLPVVVGPPHTNGSPSLGLTISKVLYPTDMSWVTEHFEQAVSAGVESETFLAVSLALAQARWRTKNPAFSEEKEWRIINLPMEFDGDIGGGITTISEVGQRLFREARGRIVSYYEVKFSAEAVVEIVLGPQCKVDTRDLDMLLRDLGLKPQIRRSVATYRS